MNQPELTHTRSTFQILLLVFFTLVLAVPALPQAPAPAEPPEPTSGAPQPASSSGKFAVWGNAGVAVPHSDFSTFFDPGFSVNGGLEYMFTSHFSAEGIFGYHRLKDFFGGHNNL